jgi:protein-S-isoprenylcysteine O-methyltransferase Ste14
MVSNRFFSAVVRIQSDRGQHVVTTGPYRFVRHPGYVGALLATVAAPLVLDALWAMVPTLVVVVAVVVRTALEDATLRDELAGYAEYGERTRYRLLPGVW